MLSFIALDDVFEPPVGRRLPVRECFKWFGLIVMFAWLLWATKVDDSEEFKVYKERYPGLF